MLHLILVITDQKGKQKISKPPDWSKSAWTVNYIQSCCVGYISGPNMRFVPPNTACLRGGILGPKTVPLQGTASNLPSTDFFRPSTDVLAGMLY